VTPGRWSHWKNRGVLQLTLLVVSIALADSLNPSTMAPALYLTTVHRPRRRVAEFAAGIFAVNMVAGALLVLGPGQLILSAVPHTSHHAKHVIELVVGLALLVFAALLVIGRHRVAARIAPTRRAARGQRAWALGAGIAAVELPTAFPYFAAIAAIVGSDISLPRQLALVGLFNAIFVLPVVLVVVALALAGPRIEPRLERTGEWLQERWPTVFAILAGAVGTGLTVVGVVGVSGFP
jgi:cytochrome c biogenesis protein CcdA